jgi:tetratricopeptide (TPR) repeat protein
MIVKNESNIITRLFDSVLPLIDCYCICDTGSTDNTVELIINYFKEKNIPGSIFTEPFRDFGYNRSNAMKHCETLTNADYLLLLDADMILKIKSENVTNIKQKLLEHTVHYVFQGSDAFYYKNVRFAKNCAGFSYWGVTHEFVQVPDGTTYGYFERSEIFINDVGDGGSKQNKFLRDIELLTKGLETIPNNDRYTFYLANSYRDSGQIEKSIETFKRRIELGGWVEEVWHSYLSIGRCYKTLNKMDAAIYYWLEGYNYFPNRIENLYEIIEYYRGRGKNSLAYEFYRIAERVKREHFQEDFLFLEKAIYDYKLDYEMTIVGYYCNPEKYDLSKISMQVLNNSTAEEWVYCNVLSNYKFYTQAIVELSDYHVLHYKGPEVPDFFSSTPSIVIHEDKLVFNIRYVNYHIDEKGGYIQKEQIVTKNRMFSIPLSVWYKEIQYKNKTQHNKQNSFGLYNQYIGELVDYNKELDNDVYVGLEDIRLFSFKNILLYTANRGLSHDNIVVEAGLIKDSKVVHSNVLRYANKSNNIEKNWVLFENQSVSDQIKCVYQWFPLTIGDFGSTAITNVAEYESPACFRHLRGSTSGVIIGNEIWFLTHMVSHEDRRFYYHMIVVIDSVSFKVLRYSRLFTFEKEKVEYTLGFVYDRFIGMFTIGYSTMDNSTKFVIISKEKIDTLF